MLLGGSTWGNYWEVVQGALLGGSTRAVIRRECKGQYWEVVQEALLGGSTRGSIGR